MDFFNRIHPDNLKEALNSYTYDPARYRTLEDHMVETLRGYANGYGAIVDEHLKRTSDQFKKYLHYSKDYPPETIEKLAAAFRFHDIGKTLQSPDLWNLAGKPSAEIRKERYDHTVMGQTFLTHALCEPRFAHLQYDPHIAVMECFMRYHHERINGKGPQGLNGEELGTIFEIAGIFDGADGKMLERPGQKSKSVGDVFREMSGHTDYTEDLKHKGEFRLSLLEKVADFIQHETGVPVLSPRHRPSDTLALQKIS